MERKMERYANDLPTVCDCIAPYVSVGSTSDLSSGGAANDCCLLHLGMELLGAFTNLAVH